MGPREGGCLLVRVDRDAAAHRCADYHRRVHARGFFQVDHWRIRRRHFLDRRHRRGVLVGRVRDHHALSRGEDAADFAKHGHGESGDQYQKPFYRRLRGSIDLAIARRWWVIGATAAAFALAIVGARLVPQQFFPDSDRPELVVELRLKEGSSFEATTEQVKKMKRCSRRTRTSSSTPPTPEPAAALLSRAQSGAAESGLRRVRRRHERRGGTRKGAFQANGDGRRRISGRVGARHATRAWPAGRLPGPVPCCRAGHTESARDRARSRSGGGVELQGARRPARLE